EDSSPGDSEIGGIALVVELLRGRSASLTATRRTPPRRSKQAVRGRQALGKPGNRRLEGPTLFGGVRRGARWRGHGFESLPRRTFLKVGRRRLSGTSSGSRLNYEPLPAPCS